MSSESKQSQPKGDDRYPFTLVATCTSTRTMEPVAKVEDLPTGLSMDEGIKEWMKLLHRPATTTPQELYRGLGFLTLSNIMRTFNVANAYIVTGGQGLIKVDEPIVPYDFTADPKYSPNIWEKVTSEPFIQTSWWRKINEARNKGANPVASVINATTLPSSVVISCSKIFLRYIANDILSVDPTKSNNFRILLSASSLGSVPMQLRPFIVAFDRTSIKHLPGNRNDVTHRAAQMFIEALDKNPHLRAAPPHVQRAEIFGVSDAGVYSASSLDIEATLKDRPDLMNLTPEEAYTALYREKGPIGGRMRFHGIFMGLKGSKMVEGEADDDAFSALESLSLSSAPTKNSSTSTESVRLLSIFIAAVRAKMPNATFLAADVTSWVQVYCKAKGIEVPSLISSSLKTSYFLKSHHPVLGMVVQGKGYALADAVAAEEPEVEEADLEEEDEEAA